MNRYVFILTVLAICLPSYVHAYVGPSVGVGVIGAIVGVVSAILLAIFGIVYYPIKRLIRTMRSKK